MHVAHKSGNTSGVLKSSLDWLNYTGFPGDVCVMFFNILASQKKKAVVFITVTTSAYQDQINAGFSKVCEILYCGIESFKCI